MCFVKGKLVCSVGSDLIYFSDYYLFVSRFHFVIYSVVFIFIVPHVYMCVINSQDFVIFKKITKNYIFSTNVHIILLLCLETASSHIFLLPLMTLLFCKLFFYYYQTFITLWTILIWNSTILLLILFAYILCIFFMSAAITIIFLMIFFQDEITLRRCKWIFLIWGCFVLRRQHNTDNIPVGIDGDIS